MNFAKRNKRDLQINKKMFEKYCEAGASVSMLNEVFGEKTLEKFCNVTYGLTVKDAVKSFDKKGRLSIQIAQQEVAVDKKNPTMLIWLGKQRLGQTDDPAKNKIAEEMNNTIKDVINAVKGVE